MCFYFKPQRPFASKFPNTFGDNAQCTRARITAAKQLDFSQDLGALYSARSNQIELTNNISYALLNDATYQNGQLAIAQKPTNFVALYGTGCKGPEIEHISATYKIALSASALPTAQNSLQLLKVGCICDQNDLVRRKVGEDEKALMTIDYMESDLDDYKPTLAGIVAACRLPDCGNEEVRKIIPN